jgi:hypothetical protein
MSIFLPMLLLFLGYVASKLLKKQGHKLSLWAIKAISTLSAMLYLSGGIMCLYLFFISNF